jgi:hypothetical protein
MKLKHGLFNLGAAVSLAACVAMGVLWVRSYRPGPQRWASFGGARGTEFAATPLSIAPQRARFLASARGRLLLIDQSCAADAAAQRDISHCGVFGMPSAVVVYSPRGAVDGKGWLGFGHVSSQFGRAAAGKSAFEYSVLSIPYWAAVVSTVILPAWWLRRRLVDCRRAREGLCRTCGYDLRASSDRCPECGAPVATAAAV